MNGNIAKTMTSNGKQCTVTREMLKAVARDQRWPDVVAGISAGFSKFAFVSVVLREFCFPRISMFLSTSSRATLGFSLFPSGQVLTIVLQSSERLHTRGQQPRKFIGTNTLNTLLFIFHDKKIMLMLTCR